jgi:hypothetical protein
MFKVAFLFRDAISCLQERQSVDEAASKTKNHIWWLTLTQILLIIGSLGASLYLIGFVYDIEHHEVLTQ